MKKYFPIVGIAFISACGTAASDEKQDSPPIYFEKTIEATSNHIKI